MVVGGALTDCSRLCHFECHRNGKSPKLVVKGGEQRQIAFCAKWQNQKELEITG